MQLKAQTRTHPSGSQSGRSAAIPLRSRSQTTLPRHPLPRSAQHLLSARQLPLPRLRTAPALRARQLPGLRAPRAGPACSRSHACARQLPRPGLRAAPVPRAGSPAPARWALPRSPAQACARASGCARGRCRGRSRVRLQWRME